MSEVCLIDDNIRNKFNTNLRNKILNIIREEDKVVAVAPTGIGKSYEIIRNIYNQLEGNIVVLVNSITLKNQYESYGEDIHCETYQSLLYLDMDDNIYKNCNYIICDECHHIHSNNKWGKRLKQLIDKYKIKCIGLTATNVRSDGINIVEDYYDNISAGELYITDAIEQNILPPITHIIGVNETNEDIITSINNKLNELDRYTFDQLINIPNILKTYITNERLDNLKVIVFVPFVKYIESAKQICECWFKEAFPTYKVNLYDISYNNTDKRNKEQFNSFIQNNDNDQIDLLFNVDMINEGSHTPGVHTILSLSHTSSMTKFIQRVGRAINKIDDGKYIKPLIFDIMDDIDRLYTREFKDNLFSNKHNGHRYKVMIAGNAWVKGEQVPFNKEMDKVFRQVIHKILDRFTKYEDQYLIENYKPGVKGEPSRLAKSLNKSYTSIIHRLEFLGIYEPIQRKSLTDEELLNIFKKDNGVYTKNYYKETYGIGHRRCNKFEKVYGVTFKDSNKNSYNLQGINAELKNELSNGLDVSEMYSEDILEYLGYPKTDNKLKQKLITYLNSKGIKYKSHKLDKYYYILEIRKLDKKNIKTHDIAQKLDISTNYVGMLRRQFKELTTTQIRYQLNKLEK